MAAPIKPANATAYGKESWGFIPTATTTAPTVAQLTAATGLNLSCVLMGDQEGLTADTEKVTLPRRLCETTVYQSNGPTTYAMSDLIAVFRPQDAASTDGKKTWETLLEGTTGYLWYRQGVASTTDVTAGQFVNLVPVEIGPATPSRTGADASAIFTSIHPVAVTGKPTFNVAVV